MRVEDALMPRTLSRTLDRRNERERMRLHWWRLDPLGRGAGLVDPREHALDEWLPVRGVWNITSTWPIFLGHRARLEAAVARRVVEIWARSVTGAPKRGPTHPGFQTRSEFLINIVLDFRDARHRAHHTGEICVELKGEAATRREHHVLRQRIESIRLDKPIRQNYTTAVNFPLIAQGRSGATINWLR